MKKKLPLIYSLFFLLAIAFISSSGGRSNNFASHPDDGNARGTYCNSCHTGGDGVTDGSITLTGLPASMSPGTTYSGLTITLSNSTGGGLVNGNRIGGFQIVATDGTSNTQVGTFTNPPAGTTVQNTNRLVQSTPQELAGGQASWTFEYTTPSVMPPSGIQFYFAGNAANGNGRNDNNNTSSDPLTFDYAYPGSSALIALPVELTTFTSKLMKNGSITLNWTTESEINNSHFEVERSVNGKSFTAIGKIEGMGTTSTVQNYVYTDDVPAKGISYYRLKQIDFDGAFAYSDVLVMDTTPDKETISVFPNPSSGFSTIQFENAAQLKGSNIRLLNNQGKVVRTFTSVTNRTTLDLQMTDLSAGTYFLEVSNAHSVQVEKIILQ